MGVRQDINNKPHPNISSALDMVAESIRSKLSVKACKHIKINNTYRYVYVGPYRFEIFAFDDWIWVKNWGKLTPKSYINIIKKGQSVLKGLNINVDNQNKPTIY